MGGDRVSTGLQELDHMLNGGLLPGRPYIVSGPPGSGKTTLCLHFLREGLKNGERCMIVTLDEPPNEIKDNISVFGWDLSGIAVLDATPDIRSYRKATDILEIKSMKDIKTLGEVEDIRQSSAINPYDITIQSIYMKLKKEFQDRKYDRIVLDSFTSLRLFAVKSENIDSERREIQSLLRFLAESEVTTLITSEYPSPTKIDPEFLVARGEIRLHKEVIKGTIVRGISIERLRGTSHDTMIRPLEFTKEGLKIRIPLFKGKQVPTSKLTNVTYSDEEIKAIMEQIVDMNSWVESKLEKCVEIGIDVSHIESLIDKAKMLLDASEYNEALECAKEAWNITDHKLNQYFTAVERWRAKQTTAKDLQEYLNQYPAEPLCGVCGCKEIILLEDGRLQCRRCGNIL
ncbi:MAG: ATPase domain-containing protein [Thermoplasmata archaeon]